MHQWTGHDTNSHYGDDAVMAHALPGQAQHQGIQLFHTELLVTVQCGRCRPDKLAFIDSPGCQPAAADSPAALP